MEGPAALDEQCLIDGLVADAHGVIIGEVEPNPVRDLLRTPPQHPASVLTVWFILPRPPRRLRAWDNAPIRTSDLPREPILHVLLQPWIRDQLRDLWPARE